MTELIIAPDIGFAPIERSGVFTMFREDARLECNCPKKRGMGCGGIAIDDIPLQFRTFQLVAQRYAKRFIERMKPRGYAYMDGSDIVFHGPFPSYDFDNNLSDIDSAAKAMLPGKDGEEHPENMLSFVFEQSGGLVDYVLVATFLIRDEYTDIPVEAVANGF